MSELETIQMEATEAPATAEKVKKTFDVEVDGVMQTMTQAAYARYLFKQGKSRGEIANIIGCPYYIVYSATANMFNEAHPEGGSATTSHRGEIITITADTRTFVPVAAEYAGSEQLLNVSRPDYMRECVSNGMARGDVAKMLDCPYSTVYAATKEIGEKSERGAKIMVTDPETGELKPRVEVIRAMYEAGKDRDGIRREIANALGCDYAVVWAATKEKKVAEVPEDEVIAEIEASEGTEA